VSESAPKSDKGKQVVHFHEDVEEISTARAPTPPKKKPERCSEDALEMSTLEKMLADFLSKHVGKKANEEEFSSVVPTGGDTTATSSNSSVHTGSHGSATIDPRFLPFKKVKRWNNTSKFKG
jgi:hypothetical protein